jgi:hypothetical protein
MRDAEACRARSCSISRGRLGRVGHVSYLFMGEHGEYDGGDCLYFGLVHPRELATIVFHDIRTPELNHRLIILGHGLTDFDKQTVAAQTALAETTSLS